MSEKLDFKVIECGGTPYEIGYAHGSQAKDEIMNSIKTYSDMFTTYGNMDWEIAKRLSKNYIRFIEQFDKDLMEEIRGVAEGAGLDIYDILALNARSEVILMKGNEHLTDGCTSVSATPEATRKGYTLLAQNWDWKASQIASVIVLKINQESLNKPNVTMVTEAGIIGKVGFNSCGVGVCLNALGTKGHHNGVPLHIILRGILNSRKISDAVECINWLPNACAANFMIGSSCGEILDIEKTPWDFDGIYPKDGVMAHANHFLTERLRAQDTSRLMAPDSLLRYGVADKLLCQHKGNIDENIIKTILSDHRDYPDSICAHEDPLDRPCYRMCTVFSVVMNLTNLKMELLKGKPCEGKYKLVE